MKSIADGIFPDISPDGDKFKKQAALHWLLLFVSQCDIKFSRGRRYISYWDKKYSTYGGTKPGMSISPVNIL